ncbi:MAG: hypothetical protein Q8P67_13585, partial [archaeon]|nr:hypothetical protein [archaeon]
AQIQGIPKLNFKQGDLVVCSFPSEGSDDGSRSGCYFGRVFKVLLTPPSSLLITFDPFERSDLYIFPAEDCRLLSPKLKAILLEGGNTHQRILVDSPIKSLFSKTGDECRNRLLAFWRANEVDQAFSELFDTPGWVVTIGDWKALDNFVLKLKILRESDEAQAFLKSITAEIFQYFDALLAKLDMTKDLFLPVYNFILFEINHFRKHIHTLTPKLWDSAVITADSKLQNISDLVLDIIEGRRKRVLCEQWHKNLHNNVVAFLSALGFIHDTLPADYIRHPPVNLGQAEINLGLIRQVLDPTNDIHRVRQFLTRCIAETYQLIDPFLVEMSTVLCNQLRLDDPSSLLDLDRVTELELEITGRSRMSRRASMNPVTTSKLVNLVRDLQYLLVMKKMDAAWLESINEPEAKQQKLELSQVVPVTGLVMGRFHMFENELATALSVWLPKMKPEKLLAPRPDTRPRSGTDPFGPTRALQDVDPILPAVVESAVEEAISASPRKDRSRTALHSRGERPFSDMHQAPQDTPLKPPVRKERPLSHLEFELAECASSDSIDEFVSQAVLRGAFNPFRASGRRESKELEKHRTVIQRYLNTQPKNEPASSNSYNNSLSGPPVAHNPPKYKAPRSSSLLRTLSKKEFNPRMAPFPGVKLHDESFRQSSLFNATPVPKPDKEKPFADVASIVPSPAFRDLDAPPPPLVTATLIEELPSPNKPGSFSGSGSIPKHSSTESVPFPGVKLYIAEETRISPRVAFSKKEC